MFNVHSARRGYWISRNWSYSVIPVQILRIGTGPLEDQIVFLSAKPSLQFLERAFFLFSVETFFLKFSFPQTILVPIKIWVLHLWNTTCVIFTAKLLKNKRCTTEMYRWTEAIEVRCSFLQVCVMFHGREMLTWTLE